MEQNQSNTLGENVENACPNCEPEQAIANGIVCAECGITFDADLKECPNCGCPIEAMSAPAAQPVADELDDCEQPCALTGAIKEFFGRIIYVLFVLPFKTWRAGVNRLAAQGQQCHCYEGIKTEWPLITYARRLFLDYMFDALILVSWLSLVAAIWDLLHYGAATCCTWVLAIYLCYLMPVFITLAKDAVTLVLRFPIRRLIKLQRMLRQLNDRRFEDRMNK